MALEFAGADTSDSTLTTLTAGAGVGTKASTYTELIASTARESYRLTVQCSGETTKETFHIFIAVGSSSSEVDILDFVFTGGGYPDCPISFDLPLTIASGVRVSACCASAVASGQCQVAVTLSDEDGYGTSTENEVTDLAGAGVGFIGQDVDPGGSANTKGSWSELIAATSHDYDLILIFIGMSDNTSLTNGNWLVDIGTGAAASESVLIENIGHSANATEYGLDTVYPVYTTVASGTRLSARAQCSFTDATDRIIDVSVIGVNITAPAGGGGGGGAGRLIGGGLIGP